MQFHDDEVASSHAFKLRGAPPYLGWNLTDMLFTQCLSLVLVKPCKRQNEHHSEATYSCMAENWPILIVNAGTEWVKVKCG